MLNDPIIAGCRTLSQKCGPKTLQEIADACGVTPSAVYQVECKALRKFRRIWQRKFGAVSASETGQTHVRRVG